MKEYWKFDRFDKRSKCVSVGVYDVDAVNEMGITNAHWEIHAGNAYSAIKFAEEHPEEFEIRCDEHLVASPVFFHETAYPMPFEF